MRVKGKFKYARLNIGHPLTRGLSGCWLFNEGSGNRVNDLVNNSNKGVLTGSPIWTANRLGQCIKFNGSTDYIAPLTNPTRYPIGNSSYSLVAWIFPTGISRSGIVGWGNYGTNNQVNAFRTNNSTVGQDNCANGGLQNYWWANDLSVCQIGVADNLHLASATFDGTTRRIFLNNKQIGSDSPGSSHNVPSTANFRIGSTNNGEYFTGTINYVLIYNRALTLNEISWLYREPYAFIKFPNYNYLGYVASAVTTNNYWRSLTGVGM